MAQVRKGALAIWRFLIPIFFLATIVQVFLAGFGIFRADDEGQNKKFEDAFEAHVALGFFLQIGTLLLLLLALIAWTRKDFLLGSFVLAVQVVILQPLLAGIGEDTPWVGGLHPVNGFLIVGLSGFLAGRVWGRHRAGAARREEPVPAP